MLARDEANTVRIALAFSALYPATTWLPIPALPQPAPLPASLHLVVLTDDGSVMATCRDPQGGWLGWTDVLAQIGGRTPGGE